MLTGLWFGGQNWGEGGWTDEEREWAERYGAESISLGSRVLRTETAALVAAAILQWEAGEI